MTGESIWEAWAAEEMHPGGRDTTLCLLQAADLPPGGRVADIGCGSGAGVAFLREKGFEALGVDCSARLCALARARGVTALCADAQCLPFGEGEMDGLLLECTLSTLGNLPAALGECRRVLKQGGALLVSDIRYETEEAGRQAWQEALAAAGFALVYWKDWPHALADFVGRCLWEGDPSLLRELCATGCGAGQGYFTFVARAEERRA